MPLFYPPDHNEAKGPIIVLLTIIPTMHRGTVCLLCSVFKQTTQSEWFQKARKERIDSNRLEPARTGSNRLRVDEIELSPIDNPPNHEISFHLVKVSSHVIISPEVPLNLTPFCCGSPSADMRADAPVRKAALNLRWSPLNCVTLIVLNSLIFKELQGE